MSDLQRNDLRPQNDDQQNNGQRNNDQHNNNNQQDNTPKNENEDTDAIYFGDSKLETEDEFMKDKKSDHTKEDNTITAGRIDDIETKSGGAGGTDRAGTFERKVYGDTELNKGLEAQAKDEES